MNYLKIVNVDRLIQEITSSSIVTALSYVNASATDCDIFFKAELSAEDLVTLNTIVANHIPTPLANLAVQNVSIYNEKKTSTGIAKVSLYEPEGSAATIATFNFCDKCSWYNGSVQVVDEVLSSLGANVYSSSHQYWIDLRNGRCYDEDTINSTGKYNPVIKVDGVVKTLNTDYTIDYVNGTITTLLTGTITASYYYANTSFYDIKPKSGKILSIIASEVQFSSNVQMTSPFVFEVWFDSHPIYGTNPVPGTRIAYKNAKDLIIACNLGQGIIPKFSELTQDIQVFPFNYARPKPLKSSDHLMIRVYILGHSSIPGEFASATFYVSIDSET